MLYYGVRNKPAWINSEANTQIFADPKIWQSDPENELSHPIFGTVREEYLSSDGSIMFESCNNIISRGILEKYIDMTPNKDNKQLKVKVSQVALNLTPGTKESMDFLNNVGNAMAEAFYTPFVNYIDYKWEKEL